VLHTRLPGALLQLFQNFTPDTFHSHLCGTQLFDALRQLDEGTISVNGGWFMS